MTTDSFFASKMQEISSCSNILSPPKSGLFFFHTPLLLIYTLPGFVRRILLLLLWEQNSQPYGMTSSFLCDRRQDSFYSFAVLQKKMPSQRIFLGKLHIKVENKKKNIYI